MSFGFNVALHSCAALMVGALHGADTAPISFVGPEVLKLDWGTRALNVSDVNGDQLNDLVVVNNDTAQLEIIYQLAEGAKRSGVKKQLNQNRWEPLLEDARFASEGITIGFPVFDLSVGDLNGDGRDDLAYSGREVPLTIRYQADTGNWSDTTKFDSFQALGWTDTIQIDDVDGDGKAELVVIAADALRVFRQDPHGHLGEEELYYVTGENPFNLLLEDVTNDGLKDVLYITSSGDQSLALREQLSDGGFGPERRFILDRPVRSVRAMPQVEGEWRSFCSVDSRSGGIDFFTLEQAIGIEEVPGFSGEQPEVYPIFKKIRASASYAFGDFNGDGQEDILVANPTGAELVLFLREAGKFRASRTFPSLSGIASMASGNFFKTDRNTVAIVSEGERAMGLSSVDANGRLSFPRRLVIGEGEPVVCEAVDLDQDGYDELAFVSEQEGAMNLVLARPSNRDDQASDWEVLSRTKLADVKRKPTAIREVAIFDNNSSGLMVFVPREAPVLIAIADQELVEVASASSVRESLLKDIQPAQVSVFDIDEDGSNELIVARSGYARALRVEADDVEMVDQFNARRGDDTVSAVVPLYEGKQLKHIALYVSTAGEFQLLARDEDGVFRYVMSVNTGKINLKMWHRVEPHGERSELIFAGEDRFWRLPSKANIWTRVAGESFETNLEEVRYSYVEGGDFDADGQVDLIAVDGQSHVVEVLVQQDSTWTGRMFWEVFEQNLHYQGRKGGNLEPREMLLSDLTGDGKLDIALLVHDRILFYMQD